MHKSILLVPLKAIQYLILLSWPVEAGPIENRQSLGCNIFSYIKQILFCQEGPFEIANNVLIELTPKAESLEENFRAVQTYLDTKKDFGQTNIDGIDLEVNRILTQFLALKPIVQSNYAECNKININSVRNMIQSMTRYCRKEKSPYKPEQSNSRLNQFVKSVSDQFATRCFKEFNEQWLEHKDEVTRQIGVSFSLDELLTCSDLCLRVLQALPPDYNSYDGFEDSLSRLSLLVRRLMNDNPYDMGLVSKLLLQSPEATCRVRDLIQRMQEERLKTEALGLSLGRREPEKQDNKQNLGQEMEKKLVANILAPCQSLTSSEKVSKVMQLASDLSGAVKLNDHMFSATSDQFPQWLTTYMICKYLLDQPELQSIMRSEINVAKC